MISCGCFDSQSSSRKEWDEPDEPGCLVLSDQQMSKGNWYFFRTKLVGLGALVMVSATGSPVYELSTVLAFNLVL